MWKAIALKELRELGGIAAVALLLGLVLSVTKIATHVSYLPQFDSWVGRSAELPFLSVEFTMFYGCLVILLAIALGLRQTLGEELRGTYPFLLHLPMPRGGAICAKLLAGVAVYSVCSGVPILVYGAWAATPGTHASPFFWSMTELTVLVYVAMLLVYLGAFLSGLRPARWLGSRFLPLAGSGGLVVVFLFVALASSLLGVVVLVAATGLLVASICHVARSRDF